MSSTFLIQFVNRIADSGAEYLNSWGGANRVWDAIFQTYGTKIHEYDNWMIAANDGRLWKLWKNENFTDFEKLVYLFTCDNALVANKDFAKLASALRDFEKKHINGGICHLGAWADFIESSKADAIGLYATTVCENPWFEWDEEKEEYTPYNIETGNKHFWITER